MLDAFLGEQERDMADFGREEIHHRYFYHLRYQEKLQAIWQHAELYPSDADPHEPHVFEFFWATLPDHGLLLPQLIERLGCVS